MLRMLKFQSTQPKRAATEYYRIRLPDGRISIHAAQEGCDSIFWRESTAALNISIHAAQEGCDFIAAFGEVHCNIEFQSTQPKRAATKRAQGTAQDGCYFNPRSPRGLRLGKHRV